MTSIKLSRLKTNDARKAVNWLIQTFGPPGQRWSLKDLSEVSFSKERDATLFLIHWSTND